MAQTHEDDVVAAFRQAVEEELKRAQNGEAPVRDVLLESGSVEEAVQLLQERHEELQREVALLRTIVLKLVSHPVDEQ